MIVKVELQTPTTKKMLLDTSAEVVAFIEPGESRDFVVKDDVKEMGAHVLMATVYFRDTDGEVRHFRKYYKFNISHPLSVKTRQYLLRENIAFVEIQIQNVTQSPMFLQVKIKYK